MNDLGHLSIISRQYKEARSYLNQAAKAQPKMSIAHFNMGILEYAT